MSVAGFVFHACSIDHADISPFRINMWRAVQNNVTQNPPSNLGVPRWGLYSAAGHDQISQIAEATTDADVSDDAPEEEVHISVRNNRRLGELPVHSRHPWSLPPARIPFPLA